MLFGAMVDDETRNCNVVEVPMLGIALVWLIWKYEKDDHVQCPYYHQRDIV